MIFGKHINKYYAKYSIWLICGLFFLGMLLKNEATAALVFGGLLGTEYLLNRFLSVNGSASGLKCVLKKGKRLTGHWPSDLGYVVAGGGGLDAVLCVRDIRHRREAENESAAAHNLPWAGKAEPEQGSLHRAMSFLVSLDRPNPMQPTARNPSPFSRCPASLI